jgi:hypothetical protein
MTTGTPAAGGAVPGPIRLQADEAGQPAIELSRLRMLSDLERTAPPGPRKAHLGRLVMRYVPALLDRIDETNAGTAS